MVEVEVDELTAFVVIGGIEGVSAEKGASIGSVGVIPTAGVGEGPVCGEEVKTVVEPRCILMFPIGGGADERSSGGEVEGSTGSIRDSGV